RVAATVVDFYITTFALACGTEPPIGLAWEDILKGGAMMLFKSAQRGACLHCWSEVTLFKVDTNSEEDIPRTLDYLFTSSRHLWPCYLILTSSLLVFRNSLKMQLILLWNLRLYLQTFFSIMTQRQCCLYPSFKVQVIIFYSLSYDMCNILQVLEHASVCLTRIIEAFASSPKKLDELCNHGLVEQADYLVYITNSGGGRASLSSPTYMVYANSNDGVGREKKKKKILGQELPALAKEVARVETAWIILCMALGFSASEENFSSGSIESECRIGTLESTRGFGNPSSIYNLFPKLKS
ncbi:hypothetical protein IFM89_013090, partial [Coptis chinensis]